MSPTHPLSHVLSSPIPFTHTLSSPTMNHLLMSPDSRSGLTSLKNLLTLSSEISPKCVPRTEKCVLSQLDELGLAAVSS